MPVFDNSGSLRVVGDRAGNIAVYNNSGTLVHPTASYLQFSGSSVANVTAATSGVLVELAGGGGTGGTSTLVATTPLTILTESNVVLWLKSDRGLVFGAVPAVTGWADNTSYENDALQSNSSLQPTLYTGSVNFNGTSQYMEVTDTGASELLPAANMLLGFRVRPDTLAGSRAWLTKGTTGGVGNWSIQYSGEFRFFAGAVGSLNYGIVNSSYFTAGAWHTVLISYNGAGSDNLSRLRIWVNGAEASCSYNGTIPATLPVTTGTPITIGCFNGPAQYFQGAYQQIVMASEVPNAQQIIDLNQYLTNPDASGSIAFTKSVIFNYPVVARNTVVWRSNANHTLSKIRGFMTGTTGCTASFQVAKNGSGLHLSATLNLTANDFWFDGGTVLTTSYTAGDYMQVRLLGVSGTVEYATIQADFLS